MGHRDKINALADQLCDYLNPILSCIARCTPLANAFYDRLTNLAVTCTYTQFASCEGFCGMHGAIASATACGVFWNKED